MLYRAFETQAIFSQNQLIVVVGLLWGFVDDNKKEGSHCVWNFYISDHGAPWWLQKKKTFSILCYPNLP